MKKLVSSHNKNVLYSNMKLSRICTEFDRGKWKIHKFGYDKDNNFKRSTDNYKDYFYYVKEYSNDLSKYTGFKVEEGKVYKTIDNEEVCRVYYTSIKNKKQLYKKYPYRVFEEDISPAFRYICDNNIEWSDNRNIVFFDIETWYDKDDRSANTPENPKMPITCIVLYSTDEKKYTVFSWNPEKTKNFDTPEVIKKDNVEYIFVKTEEEVLFGFLNYISMKNVDIISGWYSGQFDLPYIINRCKSLGIDYKKLSPVDRVTIYKRGEYWKIYIDGLDHIDLMDALKDLDYNLSNWKLKTAAEEILDDPNIEKIQEKTWKNWIDDYKAFLDYSIRDVEILIEISNKLKVFELYINLQQIANLDSINMVFFKSMIVDNYILNSFHNKIIFPTRKTKSRQKYAGAIVLNPKEPGVHKNVSVLDYTSLYPTTIMAFNISPETFIASEKSAKRIGLSLDEIIDGLNKDGIEYIDTGYSNELFGERYLFFAHSHKIGLLPFLLKKLFLKRKEINNNISMGKFTKDEEYAAYREQLAIKLILNSAYGAMGFNYFRLYTPECADAITYFAREALKFAVVKLHTELDMPVIYGDTDSAFSKMNGKSETEIKDILSNKFTTLLRNEFVLKYCKTTNDEYFLMDLKFEKDLEYVYFGNSKKRYYGIERSSNKKYIKGLNIIRKDAPKLIKHKLNYLAEKSVREKLTLDDLIRLRKDIETVPHSELGITKSFGKPFKSYKKNIPQHLKASVWANDILNVRITHNDNPLLFYIKSLCEDDLKPKDRHGALCLLEEDLHLIDKNPDKFTIDYDTFFSKQVIEQLDEFKFISIVDTVLKQYEQRTKSI